MRIIITAPSIHQRDPDAGIGCKSILSFRAPFVADRTAIWSSKFLRRQAVLPPELLHSFVNAYPSSEILILVIQTEGGLDHRQ